MEPKAFWHKKIKLEEWQLDIVAIVYIVIGILVGVFLVAGGGIGSIFAEVQTSISRDSDAELAAGTLVAAEVSGTGSAAVVQLVGGAGDWADAAWLYRRPITVSSGYGSVLTEYQVMVTLDPGNFDYSSVKAGCADIRFGDTNGNFLDYYQLVCDTGGTSQFWVKTTSLAASGNTTIYVYYGNVAATGASSMANTFSYTTEKPIGYALHDQVNSLSVISLEAGNSISHNGSTLNLGDGQTGTFSSVNTSGVISATKLFNAHDNSDETDAFVPVSFAGTEFLATSRSASSGSEEFFVLSPWGTASVTIYADGASCYANASLGSTVVSTGSSCYKNDGTTYRITSNIPILAFMDENTTDPYPLRPSDIGPWYGIGGSRATFSAGSGGSSVTYYRSDQGSAGNLNIAADRDGEVSGLGSYGAGPAFKATGSNPISGNQWADGNGGDGAFHLPWGDLGTKFGSATTMDYVAIAAPTAATCTVYNSAGGQVAQGTAASSNSQVYYLGFGTGTSNTYVSTSWSMTCNAPVYAYFEKAADSESNVWSYPQMRQFVYPTPTVANPGAEEGALSPTGSWESATDANVIDLVWNGGWGDGTGGSTAFASTVANVGVNANIVFQMRAADSVVNLAGASYVTLGTANSGTTFSKTKDELDLLALPTGAAGRYVQIKATLNSTNGIDNPQLDNFTIYFLGDDTTPATNASAIQLYRNLTGAEVLPTEWTNDVAPYFTWSAGSDTQSGIRGYCLYLGTDPGGDPELSKGLLGTSPASLTGTSCQFIVESESVDFANAALRGAPWLTSSDNLYYINIKSVDEAGNVFAGTAAQFSFKFDNTPPKNITYFSLPGDFISSKDATWTWPILGPDAADDTNSGLAGLQYRIGQSGVWYGDTHTGTEDLADQLLNDGTYTTDVDYDYPALNEGSNFVYVRAWDNAGNTSVGYVTGVLKINTISPSSPLNLMVTPTDNTINSYAFDWDPPSSFIGQANNLTYCYTVNTLPSVSTCNYTPAGVTSLDADAYANQPGVNTFYIVARDEASNINYDTYTTVQFTYSGTAPGIPTSPDIADISIKATANWRLALSWEAPTNVGAGISSYQIFRSTTNTTCTDNFAAFGLVSTVGTSTYYADTGLSQQNYYYCVKTCDSANNCSATSATVVGYPDGKFTEPSQLTSGPKVTGITTRSASITWTTDRTSDSKVSYGLAAGQYFTEEPSIADQLTDHTINLTSLLPGTTYYYRAKWTDEDGNTGLSAEQLFTTQPAPTIRNVSVLRIGLDSALIRYTAKGASSVNVLYGKTTSFGGSQLIQTSPVETTYTIVLDGLDDGTKYFYKINPVDSEGYEYDGTVLDFSTLPRPKITNVQIQEVKGAAQPTVDVIWESNTEITSVLSYSKEGETVPREVVDLDLVTGEHRLRISGLEANTAYLLVVRGQDKLGNEAVSDAQQFTTATDSRPPSITNLVVEGDIVNVGDGNNERAAQLIITWDTDEPATSQVEFGTGSVGEYTQRTLEDSNLTFNHLVVVSNLTPSQVYHFQVVSRDSASNEGKSTDTVTITPKLADSAFELVINNLLQIFGFLGS